MNNKFNIIATAVFGLTFSAAVLAADATGSSNETLLTGSGAGTVNFKGKIIDAACNVSIKGSSNSTVELGTWPTSTFKATGDTTTPQPFEISVDNCVAGNYKFNFIGTSDAVNNKLLKVSGATGVGIAIANADSIKNTVAINTNAGTDSNANLKLTSTTGSLPLQAFYQSTTSTVTAGEANATVNLTLQQK